MKRTFDQMMEGSRNWAVDALSNTFANIEAAILLRIAPAPIMAAIEKRRPDLVRLLIDKGADINQPLFGETPLIYAIWREEFSSAEMLLAAGADATPRSESSYNRGFTALAWAIEVENFPLAVKLIQRGANANIKVPLKEGGHETHHGKPIVHLLFFAIKRNLKALALAIIQYQSDLNEENISFSGQTFLHYAIRHGRTEIAIALIQNGANKEAYYNGSMTALQHAINCGHTDIAIALIQNGANKEALYNDMTPLHHAIDTGQTDIAIALIQNGANKEALYNNMTPLHYAIYSEQYYIVIALIENGANKEALYKRMTPLHRAIDSDQYYIAIALIENGANKEALYDGMTPLHNAVSFWDRTDIAIGLIENGANKEARYNEMTALHHAIYKGHVLPTQALLKRLLISNEDTLRGEDIFLDVAISSPNINEYILTMLFSKHPILSDEIHSAIQSSEIAKKAYERYQRAQEALAVKRSLAALALMAPSEQSGRRRVPGEVAFSILRWAYPHCNYDLSSPNQRNKRNYKIVESVKKIIYQRQVHAVANTILHNQRQAQKCKGKKDLLLSQGHRYDLRKRKPEQISQPRHHYKLRSVKK